MTEYKIDCKFRKKLYKIQIKNGLRSKLNRIN